MVEGDASEGLLSRLGLRRGLASKVPVRRIEQRKRCLPE